MQHDGGPKDSFVPPAHISREELYEAVWSTPVERIAAELGCSDVAIAKWCKKLRVPRPGRGYWQRLAAGRQVRRPPLPPPKAGQATYVERRPGSKAARPDENQPEPEILKEFADPIPIPPELIEDDRLMRRFLNSRGASAGSRCSPASLPSWLTVPAERPSAGGWIAAWSNSG